MLFTGSIYRNAIIKAWRRNCNLKIGQDYGTWPSSAMSYDDSSSSAKAVPRRQASPLSSTNCCCSLQELRMEWKQRCRMPRSG
jgi:hypothetical protein